MKIRLFVVSLLCLCLTGCEWWYKQPDPLGGGNTKQLVMAPPIPPADTSNSAVAPPDPPKPCVDPTPPNAEGYDPDDDDNCLN